MSRRSSNLKLPTPFRVVRIIVLSALLLTISGVSSREARASGSSTPVSGMTPEQWRAGFKESDYSYDQLRDIYRDSSQPLERRQGACQAFGGTDCSKETLDMVSSQPKEVTDGGVGTGTGGGSGGGGQTMSCDGTYETTQLTCNTMSVAGMSPQEGAMMEMMMGQLVQIGTTIATTGKNASAQCKTQADVSKLMSGINGIKGVACKAMVEKCNSSCDQEAAEYAAQAEALEKNPETAPAAQQYRTAEKKAKKQSRVCSQNQANFIGMMMQSMQFLGNMAQNSQCADQFAASALPAFSPVAYTPPSTDCSDPNNQTLACFCQKDSNKSSAMCSGFNPGGLAGTSPVGSTGGAGSMPYSSNSLREGGDLDPTAGAMGQAKSGSNGGRDPSDGGSGAPGGGGLASLGGEGDGGGGFGDPKSAITGTSGGQGGGLSAGGGSGAGGLAKNNGGKGEGLLERFNLKRFLPGQKYKARGIAGMSVKSVDGITGPMGPSIWEKATKQYQEQIQKQNVILDR